MYNNWQLLTPQLPDFSWCNIPKDHKIFEISMKYSNIFLPNYLQSITKLIILVWKYIYVPSGNPVWHKLLGRKRGTKNLLQASYVHTLFFLSGWPDWANFRLRENCLLWAVHRTEVDWIYGAIFPQGKNNVDKKGLGYILGDFFTNPSGHFASSA
jgi:hypothetical protein